MRHLGTSRRALLLGLSAVSLPLRVQAAAPPELGNTLPNARLQGHARMGFFGVPVYEIRLWVDADFSAADFVRRPLALELLYALSLDGERIARRSLEEMQRLTPTTADQRQRWLNGMQSAFPDVQRGDRLTGLNQPGIGARFWHNGRPRSSVPDGEFAASFFAIWLSPRTSEPKLRGDLLGALA